MIIWLANTYIYIWCSTDKR